MEEDDKNTFLSKLPIENNSSFIILNTHWSDETVEFKLIDDNENEWAGNLPVEDLKNSAKELDMLTEEFIQESKQALCTSGGIENFTYSIEDEKFIWRKTGKFRILYGEVSLQRSNDLKMQLILNSIDTIKDLKDKYQRLQMLYQAQSVELQASLESYRRYIDRTSTLETELLTKFCALLNAKKAKIAEMQEFIKEKNLKFPNQDEETPDQSKEQAKEGSSDDELTPKEKSSLMKPLPKRKAIMERAEVKQSIPIDRDKPGCSYAVQEDEPEDTDIFDDM